MEELIDLYKMWGEGRFYDYERQKKATDIEGFINHIKENSSATDFKNIKREIERVFAHHNNNLSLPEFIKKGGYDVSKKVKQTRSGLKTSKYQKMFYDYIYTRASYYGVSLMGIHHHSKVGSLIAMGYESRNRLFNSIEEALHYASEIALQVALTYDGKYWRAYFRY